MSVALANTDEVTLRKFLVYSVFLHGALVLFIGLSAWYQYRGNQWANVGGNLGNDVKVSLVPSAGIPMPKPDVTSESHAVDPTKGLYKEEPKAPEIPEISKDALDIPKFKEEQPAKPKPVVHPDKEFKDEPRKNPSYILQKFSKISAPLQITPLTTAKAAPRIFPPGTAPTPARPPVACRYKVRAAATSPPATVGMWKPFDARSAATGTFLKSIRPCALRAALNP